MRSKRNFYYGQGGASNDLDPGDLSRYRRVTAETRADYWIDAWDCAAVLLLPAALALLNALRRYIAHGYWFAGRDDANGKTRAGGGSSKFVDKPAPRHLA